MQESIGTDRPKGGEGVGIRMAGTKRVDVPSEHITHIYGGEAGAVAGAPPDRSAAAAGAVSRFPARVPYFMDVNTHDVREASHAITDVLRGELSYHVTKDAPGSVASSGLDIRSLQVPSQSVEGTPAKAPIESVEVMTGGGSARHRPGRRLAQRPTPTAADLAVVAETVSAILLNRKMFWLFFRLSAFTVDVFIGALCFLIREWHRSDCVVINSAFPLPTHEVGSSNCT